MKSYEERTKYIVSEIGKRLEYKNHKRKKIIKVISYSASFVLVIFAGVNVLKRTNEYESFLQDDNNVKSSSEDFTPQSTIVTTVPAIFNVTKTSITSNLSDISPEISTPTNTNTNISATTTETEISETPYISPLITTPPITVSPVNTTSNSTIQPISATTTTVVTTITTVLTNESTSYVTSVSSETTKPSEVTDLPGNNNGGQTLPALRYHTCIFDNNVYTSTALKVDSEHIGNYLGSGYMMGDDENVYCIADVYEIDIFSASSTIAVIFEDDTIFYRYDK